MSKIVLNAFSGMAPRYADHMLNEVQGSFAANLKATNGALRGFRSVSQVADFTPTDRSYARAVKLYYPDSGLFEWFLSEDANATVLQSPLTNDALDRVYFASDEYSRPQLTTLADLHPDTAVPPRNLGIVRPANPPTITVTAGSGTTSVVRGYTYVFVSDYGEESAPAPPALVTGKPDSVWTVDLPDTVPPHVEYIDTYRTATGGASAGNFFKVRRRSPGDVPFVDDMEVDLVPLQSPLDSLDNDPPPLGLQGLVQHSSGAIAGFIGKDVYFSIPYLPHAWPGVTKYSVPFEISGLAAISNSIVVLTEAFPILLSGNRPDAMAITNLSAAEPCLSPRSIVVSNNSVLYASPNGLAMLGAGGTSRPTNELLTREEWPRFRPERFIAAVYGSYYIAFADGSNGIAVALPPYEPTSLVVLDRYINVTGLETDRRNGDLHLVQGTRVAKFDDRADSRFPTTWRSKQFVLPRPINFGACQIIFSRVFDAEQQALILEQMRQYNIARFAQGPLEVLGAYPLGGALPLVEPIPPPELWSGAPPQQSLGGNPLYDIDRFLRGLGARVTIIADGATIYSRLISDQAVHKLPSGYKAQKYYIELNGSVEVQRVVLAETARECRSA